jgi:hypothetical protein
VGKDEAAQWFAKNTILRYWGATSEVILPHAAKRLGISRERAWETRHECRGIWRAIGDEIRKDDPAALARETLIAGDICVGVRARVEMEAVISEELVDFVLWIDNPGVPKDETLEFGRELADAVIPNDGTLQRFHTRLERLATAWGLMGNHGRSCTQVVYVAGPMGGHPDFNFAAFDRAAMRLRIAGYRVINPADHGANSRYTWADCLARDIGMLGHVDGVATLDDWESSRGASLEVDFAKKAGIPILPVDDWTK